MKIKITKALLFVLCVAVLQQTIEFSNEKFNQLQIWSSVIETNDIDPSSLFYTDSKLALAAEKKVRKKVNSRLLSSFEEL